MSRQDLIGWSVGAHANPDLQAKMDAAGGGGWLYMAKTWWAAAIKGGCTHLIERFPGTRWGEPPSIEHVLRLETGDFAKAIKGLQGFNLVRWLAGGPARVNVDLYCRPFTDLPHDTADQRRQSRMVVDKIIAMAVRFRVKLWIENAEGPWQEECVHEVIRNDVYAGQEPYREAQAPHTWDRPCLVTERMLMDARVTIDGNGWPAIWQPFNESTAPRVLLLDDIWQLNPARIDFARRWWTVAVYMHQAAQLKPQQRPNFSIPLPKKEAG